jgi:hypothetical protein
MRQQSGRILRKDAIFEADTIRTCDLQIRNLLLYPAELQPQCAKGNIRGGLYQDIQNPGGINED